MNSNGIIGWVLYKSCGMTSERIIQFISKYVNGKIRNNLIIMNNGGAHKKKTIR